MIDLHSHTTNSDGTWTTKELLTKAEELGLEFFSITDHDTAKSYIEIENNKELKNIFKGKLIRGAELNCTFDGIKIEVLAYNFDLYPIQEYNRSFEFSEEYLQQMERENPYKVLNECIQKRYR